MTFEGHLKLYKKPQHLGCLPSASHLKRLPRVPQNVMSCQNLSFICHGVTGVWHLHVGSVSVKCHKESVWCISTCPQVACCCNYVSNNCLSAVFQLSACGFDLSFKCLLCGCLCLLSVCHVAVRLVFLRRRQVTSQIPPKSNKTNGKRMVRHA